MSSIWNPNDRYILANGAVSANAPLSGDGSNSQPLGLDLKTDNSLSGNGTLTSPLGVVPGYNETVLWNYSGTTAVTSGTLSEAASNFDMLRICFREATVGDVAYQGGNLVGFIDIGECENDNNNHSGTCCLSFHNLLQNATIGLRYGLFYLTSPTTFTAYRGERPITAASSGTSIGNMWPTKVVGINRKQ